MLGHRKIITRVIVFLLLIVGGAIVNVAVAWGCARWRVPSQTRVFDGLESGRCFESRGLVYRMLKISPAVEVHGWGFGSLLLSGEAELSSNSDSHPRGFLMLYAFEAGWPGMSLSSEWRWIGRGNLPITRSLHDGWETPPPNLQLIGSTFMSRSLPFVLPLRPVWPGFAINTLFYAGILWLFFAAPFALRRRRRIKRGLCPACAYPVGDSDVCTECGVAVHKMREEVYLGKR